MNIQDTVDIYVTYKQSTGLIFSTDTAILKSFILHTGNIPVQSISQELVERYLNGQHPILIPLIVGPL